MREAEGCVVGVGGEGGLVVAQSGEKLFRGDFVPMSAWDGLCAEVASLASECEVHTSVVGPVYSGEVAEGYVVAGREDGVERVSGDVGGGVHQLLETKVSEVVEQGGGVGVVVLFQVEVEVTEEDVVRRGKGVQGDEVSDRVAEEGAWSRGSVDESSSEGGPGVGVDLEVQVFGGEGGGVFGGGGDVDGVLEDDGDSSPYFIWCGLSWRSCSRRGWLWRCRGPKRRSSRSQ
ncbi:hypothetical protein NDU88_004999 [Pleurodeles waltl]|uniref:Uncharacterized protein n=1 Tax=Pleurodeles waltl TaxID=8319 RepID=A0AAV7SKF1_PLEWA|nr:hypothetical protein NDU88_004999 [Pleurodeles waltl]